MMPKISLVSLSVFVPLSCALALTGCTDRTEAESPFATPTVAVAATAQSENLAAAEPAAAVPVAASVQDRSIEPWEGTYEAQLDGAEGELIVTRTASGYEGAVEAYAVGTSCGISIAFERGYVRGNVLTLEKSYQDNDDLPAVCRATLERSDERFKIQSQGCDYFHGASCYVSGEARRVR